MKKISKLVMFAVLALGLSFAACNNEDVPQGPDLKEGNTHVSVALSMSASNFKSAVKENDKDFNYVEEWAGKDIIKTVSIYLVDPASTGPVTRRIFDVGSSTDGKPYYTTEQSGNTFNILPREAAAIKTTEGEKDVWVVVNENAVVQQHLATATATDFASKYQEIAMVLQNSGLVFNSEPETSATKLATLETMNGEDYDVIVMTNVKPALIDVAAGVTAEQTVGAGKPNRASLDVERAVARVLVTLKQGFTDVITDVNGNTIGTISNVKWVLAQGENSLYVQRKEDWATPNFRWLPAGDSEYWNQAGDKYDYSGLYEGYVAAPNYGGNDLIATAGTTAGSIGEASIGAGRFILPTTHLYGAPTTTENAYAGGYRKGNTPYVLVRAKFTPSAAAIVDGGTLTNGTFYLGANGKIYSSAANAVNPEKGGVEGQTVAKYVGGKVLYYAWVNPDEIPNWYNSPVLRNNIYHIHITGFKTIGTNWNPLFPEDPDTKDPKNPDPKPTPEPVDPENPDSPTIEEPENPIDPTDPLTTPETWMSVDVKVLPWKVHSYGVDLGI